ncbi:MAG TPA: prolipoprotein diacylglyceryl transferase [bacterium]|nr:prolipoprotein diacylglyceryl transferase [bacterium]HRR90873.1 prolipoprotein diacylglyceryl transferase [bacterium]
MYPVILRLGNFSIRSWGLMVMTGIILAVLFAMREASKRDVDPENILDLSIILIISGIIGARVLYVLVNFNSYRDNLGFAFSIKTGGLAWPGAFLFALIATIFFIRWRKLSFWLIVDILAPYIALGYSVGRIGCFLNGCCFGKICEPAWWSVYMLGAYRYPTQLVSSLTSFIIFLFLVTRDWYDKPGKRFLVYIILYCVYRFIIEFYRYNSTYIGGLSITQWGMLGTLIVTSLVLYGKSLEWKRRAT